MRILTFLLLTAFSLSGFSQQKWKVDIEVEGYTDSVAYLAYRWGNKQYYSDTAMVDNQKFNFSGDDLRSGIYMVVGVKNKYLFEFVIDVTEPVFSLQTDTAYSDFKFKSSPANQDFKDYGYFVNDLSIEVQDLTAKATELDEESPERIEIQEQLDGINEKVKAKQAEIIEAYPASLVGYIMKAQQEVEVPEAPYHIAEDKAQEWRYRYYKRNYWKFFDFDDDRITFTPVYQQKLNVYFENLVIRDPDSVVADVDFILGNLVDKPEFYKQSFVYLYERYNSTKIICMDKVYVRLALRWYTPELAWWADDKQVAKIQKRAKELKPSICGSIAPNMRLKDTTGTWHELHEKDWEHTILYFWDPDCGHCKKATPEMIKVYNRYKDQGVGFFAVGGAQDIPEWRAFIREHNLNWLNVTDNMKDQFLNNFRDEYDIYAYPKVFVLDENKKIVIKSLNGEQLDKYLNKQLELTPDESVPKPKAVKHED